MVQAVCTDSQFIAEELYALIKRLETSGWSQDADQIRDRLRLLKEKLIKTLQALDTESTSDWSQTLKERLEHLRQLMTSAPSLEGISSDALKQEWRAFRKKLVPVYESLAANLRMQDIHLPSLRPTNYKRNLFHVSSGIMVLMILQHLLAPATQFWVMIGVTAWAWTMEATRRHSEFIHKTLMKVFGPIAHPHEHYRVNSATWYATALLLLTIFSPRMASALAVIVLAVGDPFAALIGRKFGKIKINAGRTLEGMLAFIFAGAAASMLVMWIYAPRIALPHMLILAFVPSFAGSLAEMYSQRIDDNFTIPMSVSLCAILCGFLFSIPLT